MPFAFLYKSPMINDITTTPDAPPAFQALAQVDANSKRNMSYPAAFAAIQREHYGDLAPLAVPLPLDKAYERALEAARLMPDWEIVAQDKINRRFEAIAVTRRLRFRDDVAVEVRPGVAGDAATLHVRSKSRLGRNDFGANAARIRSFFEVVKSRKATP